MGFSTKLRHLFNHFSTISPSLVILTGPFLDASDPLVENGNLSVSFEEKFEEIMTLISDYSYKLPSSSKILIVPSLKDVTHDFVFPQCPFNLPSLSNDKILFVSNPCHVVVNGISISMSSTDILKHLAAEEISK